MSRGLSLPVKALLLLGGVAGLPVVAAAPALVELNRTSVVASEKRAQSATLGETAAQIHGLVEIVRGDAMAVAAAMAEAAANPSPQGDGLSGVRATLATRPSFDAVRFEVPSAGVNTVLRKREIGGVEPPRSTEALRAKADAHGAAFAVSAPSLATLVVPIEMGAQAKGARGYITVGIPLETMRSELAQTILTRFEDTEVTLVLVDDQRKVIASAGSSPLAEGEDADKLPVFSLLPTGISWSQRFSVVSSFHQAGRRVVGGVQTIPGLGWAVALWRPEAEAYAILHQTRARLLLIAALVSTLSAFVALGASRAVTRPVLHLVHLARKLGQRAWEEIPEKPSRNDELGDLEAALGQAARDLQQGEAELARQERVRSDLGRFLDRELVEKIVRGEHSLALGGRRQHISVLFADVVSFTPLAESRDPEQVVALLNELFSMLTEIVFRHGGSVDKFIGDCVMAVWGAADGREDHAERALEAASDMLRFLETANIGWRSKYDLEIRLGIGVHSGTAIVGNIGSDKRMEFTAIGDTVNVAARLEAIAAPNQILLSEETAKLAGDLFETRFLGERKLPGRSSPTRVHELLG
ncbi:MAG: adenylate/guanylate cyclase domain-containing protein [Myxococcales bacterium]|nr:adenylate/guanylate cyclase domain-containing protein [Polyangiaceae bacterium]MDW8251577.1 adenylate/guanylate cyclase domain-containing protein [Myxococcales bacterium]